MIAFGKRNNDLFRPGQNTIETGGTFEANGLAINYTARITFDYEPAESKTHFYPGCDERFSVSSVEISQRDGIWMKLNAAEYYDDAIIDSIIDWRESELRRLREWSEEEAA